MVHYPPSFFYIPILNAVLLSRKNTVLHDNIPLGNDSAFACNMFIFSFCVILN